MVELRGSIVTIKALAGLFCGLSMTIAVPARAADCIASSGALEIVRPCPVYGATAELPRSISVMMARPAARQAGQRLATPASSRRPHAALVADVAHRWRIDPHLLSAMMQAESGGKALAVSSKGALGLMQVMPETARSMGVSDPRALLTDPNLALETGAAYLKTLQAQLGNNIPLIVAAYNAGPGAVRKAGMRVPAYRETQSYVGKVMADYAASRATLR
jgi:soluble lytic murein transglycosylase-like protein